MIKTGLEFARGTTDDAKALIARLFTPEQILGAYREASVVFGIKDLVLSAAEGDPSGFDAAPRTAYAARLRRALGAQGAAMASSITLLETSAQQVVQLPADSDAVWLVIVRGQDLPCMIVIYVTPYAEN